MGGGPSTLLDQPWRALPENNKENLDFMKWYKPQNNEASRLRILLHGPVGAGKSSFINSVQSVLQGRISVRVPTDATSGSSFTKQFNPRPMTEDDPSYNPSPTLDDRVHVLVSVIPADSVTLLSDEVWKKLREVRLAARDLGIPQVAILTKVDKACAEVKEDINNVYRSKYLKEQVDLFSQLLGLSPNCIFLVKNYETESITHDGIDALILCALRRMITYGEDFLNDL